MSKKNILDDNINDNTCENKKNNSVSRNNLLNDNVNKPKIIKMSMISYNDYLNIVSENNLLKTKLINLKNVHYNLQQIIKEKDFLLLENKKLSENIKKLKIENNELKIKINDLEKNCINMNKNVDELKKEIKTLKLEKTYNKILIGIKDINWYKKLEQNVNLDDSFRKKLRMYRRERVDQCHYIDDSDNFENWERDILTNEFIYFLKNITDEERNYFEKDNKGFLDKFASVVQIKNVRSDKEVENIARKWLK